jgi:hypothetical protein
MRCHRTATFALLAASALWPAAGAVAARTEFNPEVQLDASYASDVDFAGTEETSDASARMSLALPVARIAERSALHFRYRPSYVKHQDQDELDRDEHRVDVDWTRELGPHTSLRVSSNYELAQTQGEVSLSDLDVTEPADVQDRDLLLTERTERRWWGNAVRLDREESERWSWSADARWSVREHEAIEGFEPTPGSAPDVEDRTEIGAGLSASRKVAQDAAVGLRYDRREFQLDQSPDETSDALGLTYQQQLGRQASLGFDVGAARTTDEGGTDRTDLVGSFDLTRRLRRFAVGIQAQHRPEAGGHLSGTSTDSAVGVSIRSTGLRRWDWSGAARYQRREPTSDAFATRESAAVGLELERRFQEVLGLRFGADHTRQLDPEADVTGAHLALVWYPLGPRAAAARAGAPRGDAPTGDPRRPR